MICDDRDIPSTSERDKELAEGLDKLTRCITEEHYYIEKLKAASIMTTVAKRDFYMLLEKHSDKKRKHEMQQVR